MTAFSPGRRLLLAGIAGFAATGFAPFGRPASEFGLRPDTEDDQSAILQNAIDAVAGEGGTLLLPPGRYRAAGLVVPQAGIALVGVPGRSRIVLSGAGQPLLGGQGAGRLDLSGVVFDGAQMQADDGVAALLAFSDVGRLELEGVEIVGAGGTGLRVQRCGGRVRACDLSGHRYAGIWSTDAAGLSITDNAVSDCGNAGILVYRDQEGPDGTIVSGNRIARIGAEDGGTGQYGNGVNVYRAGDVMVTGNHVSECAFSAIRSNAGSNVRISGNTCLASGETAVYSEFGFAGAVIADNIVDGAAIGISIANFNEGGRLAVCSGNLLRNLVDSVPYEGEGYGIGISVEADTAVSGNVVEDAELAGLQLGYGPYLRNVAATGNVIRRTRRGVAVSVVDGAQATLIAGNIFEGTSEGAVVGMRWQEAATEDLARPDAEAFEHLRIEGNTVR